MDISKESPQRLNSFFSPLEEHKDYVFWVRSHDMSQQIYVSKNYETIWGQKLDLLFEVPMIWFHYLAEENQVTSMKQLDERHHHFYVDQRKNLVYYQVVKPMGQMVYIRDRSYRMHSPFGADYVVGISKAISETGWCSQHQVSQSNADHFDKAVYNHFLKLLEDSYGLTVLDTYIDPAALDFEKISSIIYEYAFSKRQIECLYYLCKGKSYKEIAKFMSISTRTVETFILQLRDKSNARSKFELITKFSKYFSNQSQESMIRYIMDSSNKNPVR